MGNRSVKEWCLRSAILFVGLIIAHLGVTLFLLTNLGSDPFNLFIQGLTRCVTTAGLSVATHGYVHLSVSLLIIIVLLFTDKSYIKIGTLICMLFGGPLIDLFTLLIGPMLELCDALYVKLMLNAIGCALLAFGMSVVIKSDAGTGPNDLVGVVISDKLKVKFSVIRVIVDVSFILIGLLLGGTFGIGTLICALLVGPVAGFFFPFVERWIGAVVRALVNM